MGRRRFLQILAAAASLYVAFLLVCELPFVSRRTGAGAGDDAEGRGLLAGDAMLRRVALVSEEETQQKSAPARPSKVPYELAWTSSAPIGDDPSPVLRGRHPSPILSGLLFNAIVRGNAFSELSKSAIDAWLLGRKVFDELKTSPPPPPPPTEAPAAWENRKEEDCPKSIVITGTELVERGRMLLLPCGLTLGSHITLVARPRPAHAEYDPKISNSEKGDGPVMVSQFMVELQGLRTVDGEEPPRILHFNPRLKGDWSGSPVIEQNTCYRQQWGTAQRCNGSRSRRVEETVDGMAKCEKWHRDGDNQSEDSMSTWWVNRLIRQTKRRSLDLPYPFVEGKLFVLTLRAGLEGFHINVDGRHVTSFPYHSGFGLEDATGLSLNGDLDIVSMFAASLPTSHPSFAPEKSLEMSAEWKALPLPDGPVELFIGIISAGNHFAERMAVRKSWMSAFRRSSHVVARFFVALHGRKEVNVELKKEAEFFGDIVIVPYMDSYDLVVLKTIAICEYGVQTVSAKYIMKCDDDTFVRIGSVMREVNKIPSGASLYVGNINYFHKPLRSGKWAVTYEEWPEEVYPPYANGPGYVLSSDIARFIVSEFEKHELRLFKMEDVSMGMWVEKFNNSRPVAYLHSTKFCQYGCIDGYYTAHYQSPRQMLCLWNKLRVGRPQCCSVR